MLANSNDEHITGRGFEEEGKGIEGGMREQNGAICRWITIGGSQITYAGVHNWMEHKSMHAKRKSGDAHMPDKTSFTSLSRCLDCSTGGRVFSL